MRARTGGSVIHVGVVTDPEKRFSSTFAGAFCKQGRCKSTPEKRFPRLSRSCPRGRGVSERPLGVKF